MKPVSKVIGVNVMEGKTPYKDKGKTPSGITQNSVPIPPKCGSGTKPQTPKK